MKKNDNHDMYKKIISQYADSYNFLSTENKKLKLEIESLKATLKINKKIIENFYSTHISNSTTIENDVFSIEGKTEFSSKVYTAVEKVQVKVKEESSSLSFGEKITKVEKLENLNSVGKSSQNLKINNSSNINNNSNSNSYSLTNRVKNNSISSKLQSKIEKNKEIKENKESCLKSTKSQPIKNKLLSFKGGEETERNKERETEKKEKEFELSRSKDAHKSSSSILHSENGESKNQILLYIQSLKKEIEISKESYDILNKEYEKFINDNKMTQHNLNEELSMLKQENEKLKTDHFILEQKLEKEKNVNKALQKSYENSISVKEYRHDRYISELDGVNTKLLDELERKRELTEKLADKLKIKNARIKELDEIYNEMKSDNTILAVSLKKLVKMHAKINTDRKSKPDNNLNNSYDEVFYALYKDEKKEKDVKKPITPQHSVIYEGDEISNKMLSKIVSYKDFEELGETYKNYSTRIKEDNIEEEYFGIIRKNTLILSDKKLTRHFTKDKDDFKEGIMEIKEVIEENEEMKNKDFDSSFSDEDKQSKNNKKVSIKILESKEKNQDNKDISFNELNHKFSKQSNETPQKKVKVEHTPTNIISKKKKTLSFSERKGANNHNRKFSNFNLKKESKDDLHHTLNKHDVSSLILSGDVKLTYPEKVWRKIIYDSGLNYKQLMFISKSNYFKNLKNLFIEARKIVLQCFFELKVVKNEKEKLLQNLKSQEMIIQNLSYKNEKLENFFKDGTNMFKSPIVQTSFNELMISPLLTYKDGEKTVEELKLN